MKGPKGAGVQFFMMENIVFNVQHNSVPFYSGICAREKKGFQDFVRCRVRVLEGVPNPHLKPCATVKETRSRRRAVPRALSPTRQPRLLRRPSEMAKKKKKMRGGGLRRRVKKGDGKDEGSGEEEAEERGLLQLRRAEEEKHWDDAHLLWAQFFRGAASAKKAHLYDIATKMKVAGAPEMAEMLRKRTWRNSCGRSTSPTRPSCSRTSSSSRSATAGSSSKVRDVQSGLPAQAQAEPAQEEGQGRPPLPPPITASQWTVEGDEGKVLYTHLEKNMIMGETRAVANAFEYRAKYTYDLFDKLAGSTAACTPTARRLPRDPARERRAEPHVPAHRLLLGLQERPHGGGQGEVRAHLPAARPLPPSLQAVDGVLKWAALKRLEEERRDVDGAEDLLALRLNAALPARRAPASPRGGACSGGASASRRTC